MPSGDLCSCTPAEGTNLPEWNRDLTKRFNHFLTDVRRMLDPGLEYGRYVEVQKRGALHIHALIASSRRLHKLLRTGALRRLALRHGFGHEVDLQYVGNPRDPESAARAAGYVAKYATKSVDTRHFAPTAFVDQCTGEIGVGPWTGRVVTTSRGFGYSMKELKHRQAQWMSATTAQLRGSAPEASADGDDPGTAQPCPLDPKAASYASGRAAPPPAVSSAIG